MRRLRYSCSGGIVCALEPGQLLWFVSCRGFSRVSLSGWNKENFCLSAVALRFRVAGLERDWIWHWLLPGCAAWVLAPPNPVLLCSEDFSSACVEPFWKPVSETTRNNKMWTVYRILQAPSKPLRAQAAQGPCTKPPNAPRERVLASLICATRPEEPSGGYGNNSLQRGHHIVGVGANMIGLRLAARRPRFLDIWEPGTAFREMTMPGGI